LQEAFVEGRMRTTLLVVVYELVPALAGHTRHRGDPLHHVELMKTVSRRKTGRRPSSNEAI